MDCTWPLDSGQIITLDVFDIDDNDWNSVGGVYIFCFANGASWYPLYVGETDNFSERLPNHERLDEAKILGATHVHAVAIEDSTNRDNIEQRLIAYLQPKMNTQHI